jgi:hypothetical protein
MKTSTICIKFMLCLICMYSCSSDYENNCPKEGKVIGYDMRDCMCCGGWFVEYNNDTLLFDTVPGNAKLGEWVESYGFPIKIDFDYSDSVRCNQIHTMTCIELKEHKQCEMQGEIINYNSTECACCPGWVIKTITDTIKVLSIPLETKVKEIVGSSGYPVKIKFTYEDVIGFCESSYKQITCMEIMQ